MNDDSDTQNAGSDAEASPPEQQDQQQAEAAAPEEDARLDPSEGTPLAAATDDEGDPADDDRDVRVPRAPDDTLAEVSATAVEADPSTGEPSMEDEIRRMAAEAPAEAQPEGTAVLKAWPAPLPPTETDGGEPAAEDGAEERQMEADAAEEQAAEEIRAEAPTPTGARPAPKPAMTSAMAAAHEAFSSAIRAHSQAKGLDLIDQTSFLQILHRPTGHKVYIALSVKTQVVHIETTLPIVGLFGAIEPRKDNGRIQAVMDPAVDNGDELVNVISLIDLLASGQHGPLPPPKRRAQPAQ